MISTSDPRWKTAGSSYKAVTDKFVNDFKALLTAKKREIAKEVVPAVTRMVEEMVKGSGKVFEAGANPAKIAQHFVQDVMFGSAGETEKLFSDWAIDNFFRQGDFQMEDSPETKMQQTKVPEALKRLLFEAVGDRQATVEVKKGIFEGSFSATVDSPNFPADDWDLYQLLGNVEGEFDLAVRVWATQNGLDEPEVTAGPQAGKFVFTVRF